MDIYYLANCGIYLHAKKEGILIDGLYKGYKGFDYLNPSIIENILNKKGIFHNLSTILSTHVHEDHYDKGLADEFIKRYPKTKLYLPGKSDEKVSENLTIRALPCSHLRPNIGEVDHEALFVSFHGERFLFSGDADPIQFKRRLKEGDFTGELTDCTAFLNPFFLYLNPARKFITDLPFKDIYIYHIPVTGDDPFRYRDVLNGGLKKAGELKVKPLSMKEEPIRIN